MKKVLLREVVSVIGGGTPRKSSAEYYGGSIPWVTPKDMKCSVIAGSSVSLTELGVKNSPAKLVPGGSVLVVVRSGVLKHTLPVALTNVEVTLNQDMKALVPSQFIHAPYLARLLKHLQPRVLSWVRATTADNFPINNLLDCEIDLPPVEEQRRIAAILDRADVLRAKRRKSIIDLMALERSIYWSMFQGRDWPRVALTQLCTAPEDVRCGPFGTQLQKSEVVHTGVPLWGIKNVNSSFELPAFEFLEESTAERLDSYSIIPGDIVMTRKGTIGNCAVYPHAWPRGIMHSDLLRVRLDPTKARPTFVSHQLHHDPKVFAQISTMSSGAIMPGINVGKLKGLQVINPPLEDQLAFERRIMSLESLRVQSQDSLDQLDALFNSLQSYAFSSQL